MTDQSLRRADELLSELVELVETARTLPMSTSCVVPRERLLDLLDELRETMPPEMDEARRTIANRDVLLHDAHADALQAREQAGTEAVAIIADATARADQMTHEAKVEAHEILEAGRAEHAELVSATGIHQAAGRAAAKLRAEAEDYHAGLRADAERYDTQLRGDAERYAAETRAEAEAYAGKLAVDAEDYADRTLAELAQTLQRSAAIAEQGRATLAQRRAPGAPAGLPARNSE